MVTQLEIASWIIHFETRLRTVGFVCEMNTDFGRTNEICAEMGKPYSSRLIDPLFSDFTTENCFWLIAKRNDVPMACIGVRRDVLRQGEFIGFLDRQYSRIYFQEIAGAIKFDSVAPVIDEISGTVAYFGDLFVMPEHRAGRTGFDLGAFLSMAQGIAYAKFGFDWLYAFVRERHALRGSGALYRTAFQYPGAVEWQKSTDLRSNSDWILCSRAIDVEHLIRIDLRVRQ